MSLAQKENITAVNSGGGRRSEETLGLVHYDICGKMSIKSLSGGKYFLTFIDGKTRMCRFIYLSAKMKCSRNSLNGRLWQRSLLD